jgi:amino acid adenylation domain-containing protein
MSPAMLAQTTASHAVDYDPFAGGELVRVVPTTEPQREIWLADQLGPDASLAFNESVSLRLRGRLDAQALRVALQGLLERHDALRATFGPDGETLCVGGQGELAIPLIDLVPLADTAHTEAVDARLRHAVETPFALDQGPLFRAELLRLADNEHLLLLTAHHIVCDGWSWWVVVRELGALYTQHCGVAREPLPVAEAFADYALSEASHPDATALTVDEAYWLSRFADGVPVLDLPSDRPRPAQRSFASLREDHVLDAELVAAIRRMGARRGASLFATLLAGFAGLVSRLAGQSQVVVGIPAAGQSIDAHDHLVGHCVNLLPLRFDLDPAQSFAQALDDAQGTLLDALEHQRYTFGTLLKKLRIARDPGRLPLVSVVFNIDQALEHESTDFPGLTLDFATNPRSHENFELFVNAVQVHGELRLECQYNRDLFDAASVRRWLAAYETLLRAAVQTPEAMFGSLPLVDDAARLELASLQPAATPYDPERLAHEWFEAQADATPARFAVRHGEMRLSYAELEARANRIAHLLRAQGVHRGALVGLALDRGVDMLAALLGVLKAGAGYVPLDPQFPVERLTYMAGDASLAALVTQRTHAARFDLRGRPVLVLDELDAELSAAPSTRIGRGEGAAMPDSVCYVIYTSGSTGQPKGVLVPHRTTANFIPAMQRVPGIVADDVLLAVTTLSFDIAFMELMLPLSVGAEIVIADRDQTRDADALRRLLESSGATCMQATPSGWRLLLESGWSGRAGFKAITGGEPLALDLAEALLGRCTEVWNGYGPSETTVYSTYWQVQDPRSGIAIGRPVANTSVWVLDAQQQVCPLGVPGELWIGGDGVSLGYLNRPELTAERFLADPYAGIPGARLYRTGDRGCWRADGNLVHLGRLDFQVKLRGYRIELGEIENVLARHPKIARVVVIAREDRATDMRLVAYVVAQPGAVIEEAALIAQLRGSLPEYMIPQHVITLDALPLLPNGKIDRKALPAPNTDDQRAGPRMAPRNECERVIAQAMAQVLGLPEIGIDDDFFALGGHSLLAAQLTARLNRDLGVSLSLRALFDGPTVARLAGIVGGTGSTGMRSPRTPIAHRREQHQAPLSLMQRSLWLIDQLDSGHIAFNAPAAHRLSGPMEVAAMQRAFDEMVRRQPVLRTSIERVDEELFQRVEDELPGVLLPVEDLSGLPPTEREAQMQACMDRLIAEPFDLARAPLFRARLFRLANDEHVLFFLVHHIIWDGWSFDLFHEEMATLYPAFAACTTPVLAPPAVTYGDFAAWQSEWARGEQARSEVTHWLDVLTPIPDALELPTERPRPALMSGKGATVWLTIPKPRVDAARALGQHHGATLFMTMLAAYVALLHRLTGQTDLVIGTPVRGRDTVEVEGVMGLFRNTLPLRVRVEPDWTFTQLVSDVRTRFVEALARPDVPFVELVRTLGLGRDFSRHPLYQAFFSFQDVRARKSHWGGLRHKSSWQFSRGATEDLGLWFVETADGLTGGVAYNTDILSERGASSIITRLQCLLDAALAAPEMPLASLQLLPDEERAELEAWNATAAEFPRDISIHALIEAQADSTPARIALRCDDQRIDYAELEGRANQMAQTLRSRGIGPGSLVGLCLERDFDMVIAVLAVLKTGGAYVPLDPVFPRERLAFMAADATLALMVSTSELAVLIDWPREHSLLLDSDHEEIATAPTTRLERDAKSAPESVAYVLYTSGSTGQPKGVQVPHRAVVNFLASMQGEPGLGSDDRLVAVTTLSFDIAALELFLPLTVGAEVVIASREQAIDGHALGALIKASGATVMQATPTTWRLLLEAGWRGNPGFRALVGGESLPPDLAIQLRERCTEVWNMYGPTETTVWSTCWKVQPAETANPALEISIGRPIANTTVWVLDEQRQLCPIGVPGEIWIGGEGVTLGYLNRPELTAERFVRDPYSTQPDGRLYRTGDRGRWRFDGQLEHLGRLDFQVKVRGFRVELGEIEAHLLACAGIAQAVVIAREDRPGDVRLVAYVLAQPGHAVDPSSLISQLKQALPGYSVPQHIVALEAMPLLPNGKIDRGALPAPQARSASGDPSQRQPSGVTADADPRVVYLAGIWATLLGTNVGPDDNFFDLGGHSMLAVQMANRVATDTGVRIKLIRLATQSLAQIADGLPTAESGTSPHFGARIARGFRRWFQPAK